MKEVYNIGEYKVGDFLNSDGFYVFDISDDRFKKIKENFNEYISLELTNENNKGLFYALDNFCANQGYNIYDLRLSEDVHRYPESVGIKFYSKSIEPNENFNDLIWQKFNYYSNYDENIFENFWSNLEKENTIFVSDHSSINYLRKSDDTLGILNKFKNLLVKYDEYWEELSILSPYQNINGKIELLNLDNLSAYVANRKNDLANKKEYKKLYEELIVEMDKYRETPQ